MILSMIKPTITFTYILLAHIFVHAISIDMFVRKPVISNVSMSLDGKFIAAIYSNSKDEQTLVTCNSETKKVYKQELEKRFDIYNYYWVSNTHLSYKVWSKDNMYFHHMSTVDRNLKEEHLISQMIPLNLINGKLADPEHASVLKNYYGSKYSEIGQLDVFTGRLRKKDRIRKTVLWVESDFNGKPNLLSAYDKKSQKGVRDIYYKNSDDKWTPFNTYIQKSNLYTNVPGSKTRFYITRYTNKPTSSLFIFNLATDTIEQEIYSDSVVDFSGALKFFHNPFKPVEHTKLRGVIYDAILPKIVWFDSTIKSIQTSIDKLLPHTVNVLDYADTSLSIFLVRSFSDIRPKRYYKYNAKSCEIKPLWNSRPWIKPDSMSNKKPFTFITRDSLLLHGYITLPKNNKPPYPTVVLSHGGPHFRDSWGFNKEVQLLAYYGYAVVQTNYRGSTGFGKIISEYKKYEIHKMYEDVVDATKSLINKGLLDSNRLAVMGASFGGYLSISCVIHEPDMFRCAISNVGVFDWKRHLRSKRTKYNTYVYDYYNDNFGGDTSDAYIEKISLFKKAKNIKVPVFIAGGIDDTRVNISQSERLESILRRHKIPVQTYMIRGERHGFYGDYCNAVYFKKVLTFLYQNMGKQ